MKIESNLLEKLEKGEIFNIYNQALKKLPKAQRLPVTITPKVIEHLKKKKTRIFYILDNEQSLKSFQIVVSPYQENIETTNSGKIILGDLFLGVYTHYILLCFCQKI
jgi:hypothetical protein